MMPATCKTWLMLLLCVAFTSVSAQKRKKKDHTDKVNAFTGTAGNGNTYPGAATPYGMVQVSPVSGHIKNGYSYADSTILGFTTICYYGPAGENESEILFSATTGKTDYTPKARWSVFKKKNEKASPGYYSVELDRFNIDAEVTATPRTGLIHYNFPGTENANIIVDLGYGAPSTETQLEIVSNTEVKGYRKSKSGGHDRSTYFYIRFSKPFRTTGTLSRDSIKSADKKFTGNNLQISFTFNNPGEVEAAIGISHTGTDGALKNLNAEQSKFDFRTVTKAAELLWFNELARIDVQGGAPAVPAPSQSPYAYGPYGMPPLSTQKPKVTDFAALKQTAFYTALYHTMLTPNLASDVDGAYINANGSHGTTADGYYDLSSLYSFGAKYQLINLLDKKRSAAFINSYLIDGSSTENLPFIQMLFDAAAKKISGFDVDKAYESVKTTLSQFNDFNNNGIASGEGLPSVAQTLRISYYNWCAAQLAQQLKKNDDYKIFIARSQSWKNLYNPKTNAIQPKKNGGWVAPYNAADTTAGYATGSGWQYAFFVPHDIETLAAMQGGNEALEGQLDTYFTNREQTPAIVETIGQFNPAYGFNYYVPYLFNFTVSPQKAQVITNVAMRRLYTADPDGLSANDYNGQVSAWYVMNSIGLYSITPGNTYMLGFPQYDKLEIPLENGKVLSILNGGASITRGNIYIQGINLNKTGYTKLYVNYDDLIKGNELEVFTGTMANQLFMQDLERPVIKVADELIVPMPAINIQVNNKKQNEVSIDCADSKATIYYTTDGTQPTASSPKYSTTFTASANATIKSIAINGSKQSMIAEAAVGKK